MHTIIVNGIDITDRVVSLELYDEIDSQKYIIGNTVSTQVKLKLMNKDNSLQTLMSYPFVIDNKKYYVYVKPEKWDSSIEVTLFDAMLQLNKVYVPGVVYPTTLGDILKDIGGQEKINFDFTTLSQRVLDKGVNFYDSETLERDIVGYVAGCDGKNAFVSTGNKIVFIDLCVGTHDVDALADYSIIERVKYTRVFYDQGISILVAGTKEGNTIYIDSNNPHITQEDVDCIYGKYKDLSFQSVSNLKRFDILGVKLTDSIRYDDMIFVPFSIKRTVYGGEAKDYLEIEGVVSTLVQEGVVNKKDVSKAIKKLSVNVDENNQSLQILANQVDGNTEDISSLEVSMEGVKTEVSKTSNAINKFETGSWNIFSNTYQELFGQGIVMDMPLDISKDNLRNKDICISVNIKSKNALYGSGFIGAEFEIGFTDGTKERYSTCWYAGQSSLEYTLEASGDSLDKRIYCHYKIPDKEINQVSSLKLINTATGDLIYSSNPKVEFGTYPTGYDFDVPYVRDNIEVIQKDYTLIKQEVSSLSLQSVSMETEITTIKGDVTEVEKRLQSTELKLTPTSITAMVNEKIGSDGALTTVKVTIDKNGLDVKNGAISITNNDGTKVLYADTNGNLVGNKITINNLQSTSGKIGKFGIDDKGFNYTEAVSISGKACTFALNIHPDARDSFMNWKLKTNDGTADEIVGALTYSGIECKSVTGTFISAMDLYSDSINCGTLGVSDSVTAGYVNVTSNLRVYGTTNLYDVNISGHGYVNNSSGQPVSMQRIADLVK